MRRLSSVVLLAIAAFVLVTCTKVEVEPVTTCKKVVGEKTMVSRFLWIESQPERYIVFEDGEFVENDMWTSIKRIYNVGESYCETTYREVPR